MDEDDELVSKEEQKNLTNSKFKQLASKSFNDSMDFSSVDLDKSQSFVGLGHYLA